MSDALRLAFAGLGEAATLVLPEVALLPYIQVTAAADQRERALERFRQEFEGETYTSVEELVRSPNVDAIYVATPHELHAQHAILALEVCLGLLQSAAERREIMMSHQVPVVE